MLYALAGVPREAFSGFPMPRNTDVFAPTFRGEGVMRSDDITQDPRYGGMEPYRGMPPGHLPVRSYLAVPVISPTSGDVLGGLFFGHEDVGVFDDRAESLVVGIAAQTAIALDNALMYSRERQTALQLQEALLPAEPTAPVGLELAHCYRPGTTGLHVGGDWYDVVPGTNGTVGLVIGDVMGRGVRAAATMGQLRTSIRAFAALDLRPAEIALMLNQIVLDLPDEQIATFVYCHYDPNDRQLTLASAGHLPPVVVAPDGLASAVWVESGPPLGVPGGRFAEHRLTMPPGSAIALFTDGLVESRSRTAEEGIHGVEQLLSSLDTRPDEICDKLLNSLIDAASDDDIAVLFARFS
jgi:serine phosphatase RsbU (regulator of sigma subunit)